MALIPLTFQEVGRQLGVSTDAARKAALRLHWKVERGADGLKVVHVSQADLDRYKQSGRSRVRRSGAAADTGMEAIVQALRDRIASHEIAPGTKLREGEVAREFGVSRMRIRDVFVALELRGLVQRIPNRGAVVSRIDLAQVFDIYDVREVLEGLCVRLAVENTRPEDWTDLAERFDAISEEALRSGDLDEYAAAYAEMRNRIFSAAANPVLLGMLDSIFEKTQVIMRRVMILPGRPEKGLKEHRAVLAAIRRGDSAEAERLKRANIRSA
ncbi:MAG TPA: GntR family transcriptional regulator, partial [Stellaceae bacterium]|nr:GntR family transcriptional regulator [Stellaceae bacterium]